MLKYNPKKGQSYYFHLPFCLTCCIIFKPIKSYKAKLVYIINFITGLNIRVFFAY